MPGIHLVHGGDRSTAGVVDPALEAIRFRDDYEVHGEAVGGDTVVGRTGYPDYPLRRVETRDATVLLEGRLYDVADADDHLRRVAGHLAADRREAAREWLLARDGEFVVVVHHDDRDALSLLTDPFGRLPVYYATVDGSVVVSRELKFLREVASRAGSPLGVDRLAAAQKLLFGYTLADRTLFEGVRCVPPASLVRVDGGVRVHRLFRHDFGSKAHAGKGVEANADALADRFAAACESRSRDGVTDVLSLSGGLDSRAVAAAYADAGVPVRAATYHRGAPSAADARVAESIAEALDLDWTLYEVRPSAARRRRLLDAKQGMNYLAMSFILEFFERLRADHGTMTYVTGDGGDKVLVDLTPARSPSSLDEAVEYVVAEQRRLPVAEAAAVAGVDEADLLASVERRLASYPESSFDRRYVGFLVRERAINGLVHGEDRNRYFFWSTSPFYSWPVFRYAMNCPDAQKRGHRLYAAFLDRFAPELVDVEYPNFGAPITSTEYRLKRFAFGLLSRYPALRKPVVKLLAGDGGGEAVVSRIETRLSRSDLRPLSTDAVADVVDEADAYRRADLAFLDTLLALVEDLDGRVAEDAPEPAVET